MATIRELLLQIPEYGEKALINIIKQHSEYCLNEEVEYMSDALSGSFNWDESNEGIDFWCDIRDNIVDNE